MLHTFSTEEYSNLCENIRRDGVAEGMRGCKDAMGETLDAIIDSMHGGPWRFPTWDEFWLKGMGTAAPIPTKRPGVVELTTDQLIAIRVLLCGQR